MTSTRIGALCAIILTSLTGWAQVSTITGTVTDAESGELLIGVNLAWVDFGTGGATDTAGIFELEIPETDAVLEISMVGYESQSFRVHQSGYFEVALAQDPDLLEDVVIEGRSLQASLIETVNKVTIDRAELGRAACCNLSESFETTSDVDVEFTDAVSGAKHIRMLGLDGRYIQLLAENRPGIRGLGLSHGLGFVPGTWMESIQITKGPTSVINGYEGMAGQINVEYHKPKEAEKLYLNVYGNAVGRLEGNFHSAHQVGEKASTAWFGHAHWRGTEVDRNEDGFMDLPQSTMFIGMNRWKFEGESPWRGQVGFKYVYQDLWGGQVGSREGDPAEIYGNTVQIRRGQAWSKTGWVSPKRAGRSVGLSMEGTWHDQQAEYGPEKPYLGEQRTFHANLMGAYLFQDPQHGLKAGASILVDDISEQLAEDVFARTEYVPGAYAEYSFIPHSHTTLVLGARLDWHNLHGLIATPRAHFRRCWNDQTTWRISGGSGFRIVNPIAEFNHWLNTSLEFNVEEELDPERSWGAGTGVMHQFTLAGREGAFRVDYHFTGLPSRVVADADADPEKITIRNADGFSRSHAAQIEVDWEFVQRLELRLAFKYEDVRTETGGELRREMMIPKYRGLASLGYTTDNEWQFDLTGQLVGPARLHDHYDRSGGHVHGAEEQWTPIFPQLLAQVSKRIGALTLYAGGENLTNYKMDNPILGAEDPFGPDFNAASAWGPVLGWNAYAGLKFFIE